MRWETWLLFLAASAALAATPGPAVLFVLSRSVEGGPSRGMRAIAGILSANAIYFAVSATSLGELLLASHRVFVAIKWAGSAYLVYLGLRSWIGRNPALRIPAPGASGGGGRGVWLDGFVVQVANPKALLFFAAILPQFVDPNRPLGPQMLIFGATSITVEFAIQGIYSQLTGRLAQSARRPGWETLFGRLAGTLLIAAGLGLARLGRS